MFTANSQQLEFNWFIQAGGPSWDVVSDMKETPDSQIVITGAFYDSINFQNEILVSKGDRDIFVAGYSLNGRLNKALSIGGPGYEYVKKIAVSNQSTILLPIQFEDQLEVEGEKVEAEYSKNVLVTCLDENLEISSIFKIGGNKELDITSLEFSPDSSFYLSGWFTDSLFIDEATYISNGGSDIFICKISSEGKLEWSILLGKSGDDKDAIVTHFQNGSNYILGSRNEPVEGKNELKSEKKMKSLFISDVNTNSDENNSELLYPIEGVSVKPVSILKDSSFLWVLANFKYSAVVSNTPVNSAGRSDILLVKYNTADKTVSYCRLGGPGNEEATGFAKSGDYLTITGFFSDSLVFADKSIVSDKFGSDVFIATVSSECEPGNIKSFSGIGNDFPVSYLTSESGIYLTGEFKNELVIGNATLTSLGDRDIFLARVENCSARITTAITSSVIDDLTDSFGWELDAGEGYTDYCWGDSISFSRYYTVNEPGSYEVIMTDSLGCIHSGQIVLDATKSARIEPDKDVQNFKLYPTVTSDFVYWEPSSVWGNNKVTVKVYDPVGRVSCTIELQELVATTYSINLSKEHEGIYFVEISGEGFREVSKVLVKK